MTFKPATAPCPRCDQPNTYTNFTCGFCAERLPWADVDANFVGEPCPACGVENPYIKQTCKACKAELPWKDAAAASLHARGNLEGPQISMTLAILGAALVVIVVLNWTLYSYATAHPITK